MYIHICIYIYVYIYIYTYIHVYTYTALLSLSPPPTYQHHSRLSRLKTISACRLLIWESCNDSLAVVCNK